MQVRGGRIRGLDLHLDRLRSASMEMFGQALHDDRVRSYLRTALEAGPADHSLTATLYSPAGESTVAGAEVEPDVLVRTGPPTSGPEGPLALTTVEHERALPAVKHVGEVAKTYYLRQAAAQGFDDAAFVDRRGRLSEATIWNLAFWDGDAVVWPEAEMLGGTTMGIVRRQLDSPRRPPARRGGHPRRPARAVRRRGHELLDAGSSGAPDRLRALAGGPVLPGAAAPGLRSRTAHLAVIVGLRAPAHGVTPGTAVSAGTAGSAATGSGVVVAAGSAGAAAAGSGAAGAAGVSGAGVATGAGAGCSTGASGAGWGLGRRQPADTGASGAAGPPGPAGRPEPRGRRASPVPAGPPRSRRCGRAGRVPAAPGRRGLLRDRGLLGHRRRLRRGRGAGAAGATGVTVPAAAARRGRRACGRRRPGPRPTSASWPGPSSASLSGPPRPWTPWACPAPRRRAGRARGRGPGR